MPPTLSEDEIDDLLYYARTGDTDEFHPLKTALCERENITIAGLLEAAKDQDSGNGVLHMAAANGHHSLIQDLCRALSHPSPQNAPMLTILNAQNKAGNTALHWAALNGHLESVKVLLEQGADPTIANQKGHDAVYEAELNDKAAVVEWVLKESEGLERSVGGGEGEGEGEGEEVEIRVSAGDVEGVKEGTKGLEEEVGRMEIQDR